MSHRRHRDFRLGDRTELLAEFCLNTMAFTTRVPRQEDIGHDFFCVLAERDGDDLYAGPFFTVQVKSDESPLVFNQSHERKWLSALENPFFLVVGHKEELRIDIYTTWNRLLATLSTAADRIVLRPGEPTGRDYGKYEREGYRWIAKDGSEHIIWLGKPIITGEADDFMEEERSQEFARLMREWILLDRRNITNAGAGIHWVVGPPHHSTNQAIDGLSSSVHLFLNPENLDDCQFKLGQAATELRLTIQRAHLAEDPQWARKVSTLDSMLCAYGDVLDLVARGALKQYCRLHVGDEEHE